MLFSLTLLACVCWLIGRHCLQQQLKYPPGPPPIPLLGNILDLGGVSPWITYQKWGRKFGDLLHFNILGRHIVVINSSVIATELFERRSRIYSNKPSLEMLNLMGWDFNLAFMQYNDERRHKLRRIMHKGVGIPSIANTQNILHQRSEGLLLQLLHSPDKFMAHLSDYVGSLVLQHTLGLTDWNKYKYIIDDVSVKAVQTMSESVFFGAQAVFAFPLLGKLPSWFPGAGFKNLTEEQRVLTSRLREEPLQLVKDQMACGNCNASWMADMLEENGSNLPSAPSEDDIKNVVGTMLTAGAHTTVPVLQSAILALVLNPHVQKHAQEEIDSVVGHHRLPSFKDQPCLPYISAICREVLRWHAPTPLGAHSVSETDEFQGYEIPGGSAIMANIWAMSRDPDVFTDADKFIPERFIDQGRLITDSSTSFLWGFGRRSCAGQQFAEATLWIAIARILAVFKIDKARTSSGKEIEVQENYSDFGLFVAPKPFRCSLVPRSSETCLLLNSLSDL